VAKSPPEPLLMTLKERKSMIDAAVLHIITPLAIVICAIFVAIFRDLLYAAVALAVLSLLLAVEFYLLRAPDVAIAEAGIGAAVTTAIFIIAIRATKRME
jgi:energy-converting hydrogenase B subunit D